MNITYKLQLKSRMANVIATHGLKWTGGKSLLGAVDSKIRHLNRLAKEKQVYSCPMIVACQALVDDVQASFLDTMGLYQKQLGKVGFSAGKLSAAVRYQYDITVSNPQFLGVLRALESYDVGLCLILAAKQYRLFPERRTPYDMLYRHKEKLHCLLSSLIQMRLSDLPQISIPQYLDQNQKATDKLLHYADIHPRQVIYAIEKELIPQLSVDQAKRWLTSLYDLNDILNQAP